MRGIMPFAIVVAFALVAGFVIGRGTNSAPPSANASVVSSREDTTPPSARQAPPARHAAAMIATTPMPTLLADSMEASARQRAIAVEMAAKQRDEPIDAAWATATEKALSDLAAEVAVAAGDVEVLDYEAECRSATCRIGARFAEDGEAQDWSNFLLTSSGPQFANAELFIERNPDGSSRVLIFGSRR